MGRLWVVVVRLRPVILVAALVFAIQWLPSQIHELYLIDIETFYNQLEALGASEKPFSLALLQAAVRAGGLTLIAMALGVAATLMLWLGSIHLLSLDDRIVREHRANHQFGLVLVVLLALAPTLGVLAGLARAREVVELGVEGLSGDGLKGEVDRYMLVTVVLVVLKLLVLGVATWAARPMLERLGHRLFSPIGFTVGAAAIVAFSLAIVQWPTALPWTLGTQALVYLFIVALAFVLTSFSRAYRITGIPVTVIVLGCAILFSAMGWTDNHKVEHKVSENQQFDIGDGMVAWLKNRPDLDFYVKKRKPYPVYLVAAEGGGIFAGYHVASFLARMQATCPHFAQHVFGISSVSGGSLGAAAFVAHIHSGLEGSAAVKADAIGCQSEVASDGPVVEGMAEFFRTDLLAPLVAATLFPDMLQRLIPVPIGAFDRARALERAFSDARAAHFTANGGKNPFELSINDLWDARGVAPALFLNTTSVELGARVMLGPLAPGPTPNALHVSDLLCFNSRREIDVSLATATSLSARFPWLTPAGWLRFDPASNKECGSAPKTKKGQLRDKLVLVDGGYYENSGLETTLEIATRLRHLVRQCRERKATGRVTVVASHCAQLPDVDVEVRTIMVFALDEFADQIMGNGADLSASTPGELHAPLKTMLNTRRTRTRAVHLRQSLFDENYNYLPTHRRYQIANTKFLGHDDIHHVMLDGVSSFLPLGWRLSRTSIYKIAENETAPTKMTFELIKRELMGEDTEAIKRPPGLATR